MVRKGYIVKRAGLQTTLLPHGLPEVFKEIYYWLYTNSNIPRAERLGAEMIRLLFCKIYDELYNINKPKFKIYPNEDDPDIAERIKLLFKKVKKSYPDVFDKDEKLYLDDKSISHVVRRLQDYKFFGADRDAISEAFQAFWGPGLRGEKGQFFTPRNVIKLCVKFLDPKPMERIIDPACGSGGFLIESIDHLSKKVQESELKSSVFNNIFGIDKEIDLVKIAKAYMAIIGDGHSNIFCADSLNPDSWPEIMKEKVKENSFDIVFTNPPFGARISVDDKEILKRYKLGHKWEKIKEDQWKITDTILPKQAPQVLFLERCLQLLKPGGRMAIVLPDGVFGNPTDRYIFQYIFQISRVLAIISMPPETFLPGTHTKTSVLFLEKKDFKREKDEDYEIFMAIANKVGHDKDGKPIYKMNENGEYILDEHGKRIIDDDLPEIVKRFNLFKKDKLTEYSHLGFAIKFSEIREFILIPNYYDPEIKQELNMLERTGKYELISLGELMKRGLISIRRGHEVGSRYYGMGSVPFVRTSDIVNWEIKVDPVKSIPEEIYKKYKKIQDIKENDILLITDGTFLIGRTAIVTPADKKIVIQSHIRRIRCLKPNELHPFLLLFLLNTDIVQKQIKAKTFVQATISTVGSRLKEIILPIPKERYLKEKIINDVSEILRMKLEAKIRISKILNYFNI
ncbi:MAG: N-6 DNA methylase [Candidatus Aenigmatarchaeota archaeon]